MNYNCSWFSVSNCHVFSQDRKSSNRINWKTAKRREFIRFPFDYKLFQKKNKIYCVSLDFNLNETMKLALNLQTFLLGQTNCNQMKTRECRMPITREKKNGPKVLKIRSRPNGNGNIECFVKKKNAGLGDFF